MRILNYIKNLFRPRLKNETRILQFQDPTVVRLIELDEINSIVFIANALNRMHSDGKIKSYKNLIKFINGYSTGNIVYWQNQNFHVKLTRSKVIDKFFKTAFQLSYKSDNDILNDLHKFYIENS